MSKGCSSRLLLQNADLEGSLTGRIIAIVPQRWDRLSGLPQRLGCRHGTMGG
jgi:hypothetical protein